MLPVVLPIQPLQQSNSHNNSLAGPDKNTNITNSSNNVVGSCGSNNINSFSSNSLANNNEIGGSNVAGLVAGGTSAGGAAAKNQLEQLNTMREALFSQDGWGCQHVNQDTNWEVPSSPEPTNKDPSGPPMWKPNVNNGTDLWESNLRNGGQPPTQQVQKPSWGHTPTSNLGGTWGEDDDGADSSSVWSGSVNNPTTPSGVGVGATGVGTGVGPTSGSQWGQNVGMGATGNAGAGSSGMPGVAAGGSTGATGVNSQVNATGPANVANAGNGWGDPREIRNSGPLGGGPIDMRNVDPRDTMRASATGDPRDLRLLDPRDPIRGDPRGISGRLNGTSEMWGHHQQISHNQMPTMNKMVGQVVGANAANVAVTAGGVAGLVPGGVAGTVAGNVSSQWGGAPSVVGPKDITKQVTGWEEPSPPPQRRNIPNYDDGTSLWGQQTRVPGGGSHWKDMSDSMNRGHLMRGQNPAPGIVGSGVAGNGNVQVGGNPNNPMSAVVGPQARLPSTVGPGGVGNQHKPDGSGMWVHPGSGGRNPGATWPDEGHSVASGTGAGPGWVDDKTNTNLSQIGNSGNSWNDSPSGGWSSSGKQNKLTGSNTAPGWNSSAGSGGGVGVGNNDGNDINADWSAHGGIVSKSQQQKLGGINVGVGGLTLDMIKQSKQFRILVETGFKKDDVERALISANMNIEEAAELLRANSSLGMDGWRRHDESLGSYDHANSTTGGGFPGRYPATAAQPSMSFPPNNLLNNIGGSAVSGGSNNPNMAALQVQKYLNQGPHAVGPQPVNSAFGGQGAANSNAGGVNVASNSNNQPSAQQLRMLVQQIQLAVHSGFLSSQILNQPLAPATLILLNQLLSNIKHLQAAQQSLSRGGNTNPLALNVAIAKYKQQIQNLQNQINAQQAIYIKQQQQQQQSLQQQQNPQQQPHPVAHLNTSNEYLRGHDAISALQGNFSELNLNKAGGYQGAPNQQSRLNQWKLPVLEKDMTTDSTDFSRAPGATKQNISATNSNNMGPLGLQSDGTWSTGRNLGDGWPDSSNENENKDWTVAQPTTAAAYTDLVQEFEPGKPWKGAQIKNIEDDPSITPGSVARSPLSINPTPKDADIFASTGKNSPTDLPPLSLSSSTWSFNPNQNFPSWSDNPQQCATSELWTSLNKTSRGPPPGLSANKSGVSGGGVTVNNPSSVAGNANGWLTGRSAPNNTWQTGGGNTSSWSSNWLLLKNLSAQIDGSTLRTLCMQHGPLVSFHLYLNQGIALCKYATREEASKAQMTLNNCVLGNTTIFAESPNESEVQNILQHLPQTQTSTNPAGAPGANGGGSSGGGNGNGGGNGSSGGVVSNMPGGNGNNGGGNGGSSGGSNTSVGSSTSVVNVANVAASANSSSGGGGNNNTSASSTASSVVNGGGGGNINNSSNNGKNTSICGNNSTGGGSAGQSSLSSGVPNNTTWRQTTQNQTQQNQTRTGRETEFDFSQYVCSIVDD